MVERLGIPCSLEFAQRGTVFGVKFTFDHFIPSHRVKDMKRFLVICLFAFGAMAISADDAQAQQGFSGFAPFGFYQPYGARYSNFLPTPPYFATNPPVYYGARYARPYGLSPFASPPLANAPNSYRGRPLPSFYQPSRPVGGCCQNPYLTDATPLKEEDQIAFSAAPAKGPMRNNPFVPESIQTLVSEIH